MYCGKSWVTSLGSFQVSYINYNDYIRENDLCWGGGSSKAHEDKKQSFLEQSYFKIKQLFCVLKINQTKPEMKSFIMNTHCEIIGRKESTMNL